ncbi:dihydrofolate reductase family protein [uncultured Draconibacterium sp.]|uniref:dihydrofolate reductase family protein n=1 Tax=uncultured Draconibacterium sp. TaxID=1573823 RepID=UPI0032600A3A
MTTRNYVFIAKSIDGFIADKDGRIDYLYSVPNPENLDLGYNALMKKVDAILMGRLTFEKVMSFGIPWPYTKPVFVLSTSLKNLSEELKGKVTLLNGHVDDVLKQVHSEGYTRLYIDGGTLIQSFLKADLIDEMILTTIPILLGGGIPLFGNLPKPMMWEHVKSEVFLNALTQDTYQRKR